MANRPKFLQKEFRLQYWATFLGDYKDFSVAAQHFIKKIFAVNLTAFIFGMSMGFPGPHLELFKSDSTPLSSGKITTNEESWISSLSSFGGMALVLPFGWFSEQFGRKIAILLLGIPQTVSLLCQRDFN